jgi:acetyltransferase-like isoleucine patch superfamily enzyme
MNSELLDLNNIILSENSSIDGDGWLEQESVVSGVLKGRFYVGAYSRVDENTNCLNCFIGRFSTIETGVVLGYEERKISNFSVHSFARGNNFAATDEYYEKIKSRYYYEQEKYTFVGSDVIIGRNSTITEGCRISDGVIVEPNSFVNTDIPPYAIASGTPAVVVGYRFPEVYISKLLNSKWWMKDISSLTTVGKSNVVDYVNNFTLIDSIHNRKLPELIKKKIHINTVRKTLAVDESSRMIVGPSHVDLWFTKYNRRQTPIPKNSHLIPIPALSSFSDQLHTLVEWWLEWFDDVILFVPDFRIGNVATDKKKKDGRYIRQDITDNENSLRCYELGLASLDKLTKTGKVKLFFWCLFGREFLNKKECKYINLDGEYEHPIWNYSKLKEIYKNAVIDMANDESGLNNLAELIVDSSIHPTHECYELIRRLFETVE